MVNGLLYFGIWLVLDSIDLIRSGNVRSLLGRGSAQEPGTEEDVTLLQRNINWRHLQIAERERQQRTQIDGHVSIQLRHMISDESAPLLPENLAEQRHCNCCCCRCCNCCYCMQCCDDLDDECPDSAIECFCDAFIAVLLSAIITFFLMALVLLIWKKI